MNESSITCKCKIQFESSFRITGGSDSVNQTEWIKSNFNPVWIKILSFGSMNLTHVHPSDVKLKCFL